MWVLSPKVGFPVKNQQSSRPMLVSLFHFLWKLYTWSLSQIWPQKLSWPVSEGSCHVERKQTWYGVITAPCSFGCSLSSSLSLWRPRSSISESHAVQRIRYIWLLPIGRQSISYALSQLLPRPLSQLPLAYSAFPVFITSHWHDKHCNLESHSQFFQTNINI